MSNNTSTDKKRKYIKFGIMGAGLTIMLILAGFMLFGSNKPPASSNIAPVRSVPGNPGGEGSAEYNKKLSVHDEQKANAALKSGESFMPTPIGQKKPVVVKKPEAKPAPTPPPQVRTAPVKPTKQQENALLKRMMEDLNNLDTKLSSVSAGEGKIIYNREFKDVKTAVASADSPVANVNLSEKSVELEIKPGDLLYATIDTGVNSDVPSAVLATIASGKYRNGRLLGGFQRHDERIVLSFNRIVLPEGRTFQIEGYAVDPDTSEASVASSVDNHYLSRWGGLIAAAFLEGFGTAKRYSGAQSTIYGNGVNSTDQMVWNNYSIEDQAWIAAGKVGEKAGKIFEKNFDRPPTVYLNGGTTIGVLILNVKEKQNHG